jgi:DNA ligase (NAD+)
MVKELADLYTLDIEEIAALESSGKRVGEKNATKAIENLLVKKDVSLSSFIAGFDISGIGEKNIDILVADGLDTLDLLRKQSIDDLQKVKGFGEAKAVALVNGLVNHKTQMNNMFQHVSITTKPIIKSDISVCFTGALTMKRKDAEDMAKEKGWTVKKTVTKGLTYLVTDSPDSVTKKNTDARKNGIKIIGEEEFIEM